MTLEEYRVVIREWCADVEREALRLYESGVLPAECTGLAITVVESRRKEAQRRRASLAAPLGPTAYPPHARGGRN